MTQGKTITKSKAEFRSVPADRAGNDNSITDLLKKYGDDPASEYGGGSGSNKEALANKLWELALDGDLTAIKYIFDRVDGRPTERHKIDTVPSGAEEFVLLLQQAHAERNKFLAEDKQ